MEIKQGTLVFVKSGLWGRVQEKGEDDRFFVDLADKQVYLKTDQLIPFIQDCAAYRTISEAVQAHLPEILAKMITMNLDLQEQIKTLQAEWV